MPEKIDFARDVALPAEGRPKFSICTMVTRPEEYREFHDSFVMGGFTGSDCEYLCVDNSTANRLDAFQANNRFLVEAKGDYIILCHQDILLLEDDRARLEALLAELTVKDPDWGVCGNAGATSEGAPVLRITDPNMPDISLGGPFPVRVVALDENFMIARREANLALSHDLSGYHWYGPDLCAMAGILGYSAYVIDFHLKHKSGGNPDQGYHVQRGKFGQKYRRALTPRWQYTTVNNPVFLSGVPLLTFAARVKRKLRRTLFGERFDWP
jgi:hypothetical protein